MFSICIVKMLTASKSRCLCTGIRSALVGRDMVDLKDWYSKDIKSVIWNALDLKSLLNGKIYSHMLQGKHVTLMLSQPEPFTQSVAGRAVNGLGASLTTVIDKSLENMGNGAIEDIGRALSTTSDIIFVHSNNHSLISKLADGAVVPTVAWRSEKFASLQALADLMTMYEHFNILSPLTLSWVGPITPLFNSYLDLMPRMKINLRFCCNDTNSSSRTSPAMMNVGIKNAVSNKTEFHECLNPVEAVNRVDVIVTTGHDISSLSLTKKDADEASLQYLLFHEMPRGKLEVSEDLFRSGHSAVWKSHENMTWITMAVLASLLHTHRPLIAQPKWEIE